jgi:hypothetical protein
MNGAKHEITFYRSFVTQAPGRPGNGRLLGNSCIKAVRSIPAFGEMLYLAIRLASTEEWKSPNLSLQ